MYNRIPSELNQATGLPAIAYLNRCDAPLLGFLPGGSLALILLVAAWVVYRACLEEAALVLKADPNPDP